MTKDTPNSMSGREAQEAIDDLLGEGSVDTAENVDMARRERQQNRFFIAKDVFVAMIQHGAEPDEQTAIESWDAAEFFLREGEARDSTENTSGAGSLTSED